MVNKGVSICRLILENNNVRRASASQSQSSGNSEEGSSSGSCGRNMVSRSAEFDRSAMNPDIELAVGRGPARGEDPLESATEARW